MEERAKTGFLYNKKPLNIQILLIYEYYYKLRDLFLMPLELYVMEIILE